MIILRLTETGTGSLPVEFAWQEWVKHSCVEFNSGHLWTLECEPDDEYVGVYCRYCYTSVDDLFPDAICHVYAEFPGITVEAGKSNATNYWCKPVDLKIHTEYYGYFGSNDYDVFIELT